MKSRSSTKRGLWALALLIALALGAPSAKADDLKARVDLAKKMVDIMPAAPQIEAAVEAYINASMLGYPQKDRDTFRRAMLNVMNPEAIEKSAIDAYASTFTVNELKAMVEYYSKPEGRSASNKQGEFTAKLTPEIIKLLDQAVIRLREKPAQ